jgi:GT2 family glycosyltransferase
VATVVIVSWNGAHLLAPCLTALSRQRGALARFGTVVVDNGSSDGTSALLSRDFPEVIVRRSPTNVGFAGGGNLALREVTTPYAVLLNNDAEPLPDWLHQLLVPLERQGCLAAATSKVLFAVDPPRVNNAGGVVRRDGYAYDRGFGSPNDGRWDEPDEVFAFSGTAVALRTAALDRVGYFDDRFFMYYEDTDLSWRLRLAGWRIRYQPTAVVRHRHAASSGGESSPAFAFHNERNRLLMLTKDAPAVMAVGQLARFPVTTVRLAVRRLRGGVIPPGHNMRPSLRLRVLASYTRLLPAALGERRRIGRAAVIRRRALLAWLEPVPQRRPTRLTVRSATRRRRE